MKALLTTILFFASLGAFSQTGRPGVILETVADAMARNIARMQQRQRSRR